MGVSLDLMLLRARQSFCSRISWGTSPQTPGHAGPAFKHGLVCMDRQVDLLDSGLQSSHCRHCVAGSDFLKKERQTLLLYIEWLS